jgi:hypothetical protein
MNGFLIKLEPPGAVGPPGLGGAIGGAAGLLKAAMRSRKDHQLVSLQVLVPELLTLPAV